MINLQYNSPNQPFEVRTKNWVEVNNNSRGTCNTNSQIKLKTSILNSVLCNYNDAYIIAKDTVTVEITARAGAVSNNNKKVSF